MGSAEGFESFLFDVLANRRWTVESIALLLRRGACPGLCHRHWDHYLHLALDGSECEGPEGLKDALILLIKAGADVSAEDEYGKSVSHKTCQAETFWREKSAKQKWGGEQRQNYDLRLKEIWIEALHACGYNAEEVISGGTVVREVSNSDDDMQDQHDEVSPDGPDSFAVEDVNNTPSLNYNILDRENQSDNNNNNNNNNNTCQRADSAFHSPYDWSLLEEGTNVWRS